MSIAVALKEGHSRMLLVDWGGWGITEHESLEEAISALFAKVRSTDYLTVPFHGSSLNKEHWFRVSGDFSKVCTAMSDSHDSFYPAHCGQAGKGSFAILIDRSLRFAASVTSFDDDDEQEIHVSFRPSEEPLMESFVTAYGQNLAAEGISAPRSF